jgi:hypothetical protein
VYDLVGDGGVTRDGGKRACFAALVFTVSGEQVYTNFFRGIGRGGAACWLEEGYEWRMDGYECNGMI